MTPQNLSWLHREKLQLQYKKNHIKSLFTDTRYSESFHRTLFIYFSNRRQHENLQQLLLL